VSRSTCDVEGCENPITVAEGEPTDGRFVSFAVTPHDVEDVEKRAVSVCEDCGRDLAARLPGGASA